MNLNSLSVETPLLKTPRTRTASVAQTVESLTTGFARSFPFAPLGSWDYAGKTEKKATATY